MYYFTDFGISLELVELIKMCLNEAYKIVCVGKYLSAMFPIRSGLKKGDIAFKLCIRLRH